MNESVGSVSCGSGVQRNRNRKDTGTQNRNRERPSERVRDRKKTGNPGARDPAPKIFLAAHSVRKSTSPSRERERGRERSHLCMSSRAVKRVRAVYHAGNNVVITCNGRSVAKGACLGNNRFKFPTLISAAVSCNRRAPRRSCHFRKICLLEQLSQAPFTA